MSRAFVTHQLNQNRVAIFNGFLLFLSLFINISEIWKVLAVPFLGIANRDAIGQHIPTSSRASKYAYMAIAYPLGNLLAVLGIGFAVSLLLLALITLPIIAFVVIGIWAFFILGLFLLWFFLYRYPIFEVIYPRLRKRMFENNSKVYSKLPQENQIIRVVRLKAGKAGDKIHCDLVEGPLGNLHFEALSYVWGVTLIPYTIFINDKEFFITSNLHGALKELRHPEHDRLLWIDAICINQNDNIEKGHQVQMMRDIYAKATTVCVWLGEDTKDTSSAFAMVQRFASAEEDAKDTVWNEDTQSASWKKVRRELERILEYEWWSRAWIIQEVVMGNHVVLQRGPHQVEWESFHRLLTYSPFLDDGFDEYDAPNFAADIQEIRTEEQADEPISNTLLGLAYRFRYQSATFGSDKLYALLGLLKADNPSLITPDYNEPPEEIFLQFTVSCLRHNQNLTAIVLATGTELQGVSWCRDWRFTHDGSFEARFLSTHGPYGKGYSASGNHLPVYEADIPSRTLSVKGYEVDVVDRIGGFHMQIGPQNVDWDLALRGWEHVAGKLLEDDPASESRIAFNKTITADCWTEEPLDWRKRITGRRSTPKNESDKSYVRRLEDACISRRFFVTKNGRFGLGPWNIKKGDTACVLLGGKTPFILRACKNVVTKARGNEKSAGKGTYQKVIGEAYVFGCMYYEGSMEDDIKSGNVVPTWFHLL